MTITTAKQVITLHYAPDNASLVVRLLLEELGVAYETKLVDRSCNAQKSVQYLALNPDGLIPVCIINGASVFETAAILLSLADMHERFSVHVDDALRPQFLKWLFFISNSVHSDLRQRFYPEKFVGDDEHAQRSFNRVTLQRLCGRFAALDAAYKNSDHNYLFGPEPTIIELYLAVCFRWAQLYPVATSADFEPHIFPAIVKMVEQLEQRCSIRVSCQKEGISGCFFSRPDFANPPEGVAL